jgi:hypothetical protein
VIFGEILLRRYEKPINAGKNFVGNNQKFLNTYFHHFFKSDMSFGECEECYIYDNILTIKYVVNKVILHKLDYFNI